MAGGVGGGTEQSAGRRESGCSIRICLALWEWGQSKESQQQSASDLETWRNGGRGEDLQSADLVQE